MNNRNQINSANPVQKKTAIVVGLAGQPNVGKSTIFNLLTGLNQHVGNWPGKTVERKEGFFTHNDTHLRIIDLPGTYSLSANSTEERITRDFILHEQPDVVVMVADASALERNLYLLAELLVLPAPVILVLNMMDIAESEGIQIEPQVLEAALGLPVLSVVASRNEGVSGLIQIIEQMTKTPQEIFKPNRPDIAEPHRQVYSHVQTLIKNHVPQPYSEDWVALKLLEGDREITNKVMTWLPEESQQAVMAILKQHEDAVLDIAGGRYEWIARMVRAAITNPKPGQISITDKLDKIAVHPFWGMLLLMSVFALVFWLTFTLAMPIQNWLDVNIVGSLQHWFKEALATAPNWLADLFVHGILGGAGIVITFAPILIVFFFILGLLEDSGYLARSAYVMDRFMHALGLHGKSFLPLFLGFGCNVPAVMGTRVIESESGRLLTILLAPLVPCSARLMVLALLAPAFFGNQALTVSWALITLNMLILALLGIVLNHTIFRGEHTAFIMELPLYHKPGLRAVAFFVWQNTWAFLRKAGTIILVVSVVIWVLSRFPGPGIEQSYLASLGRSLAPVGKLMGMDWRLIVALLSSFIAKENAIATLAILYRADENSSGLVKMMVSLISPATALSFLVVTMLFIPCVATVAVMYQETRSWRWTLFSVGLLLGIALLAGVIVYQGAHWLGWGV